MDFYELKFLNTKHFRKTFLWKLHTFQHTLTNNIFLKRQSGISLVLKNALSPAEGNNDKLLKIKNYYYYFFNNKEKSCIELRL